MGEPDFMKLETGAAAGACIACGISCGDAGAFIFGLDCLRPAVGNREGEDRWFPFAAAKSPVEPEVDGVKEGRLSADCIGEPVAARMFEAEEEAKATAAPEVEEVEARGEGPSPGPGPVRFWALPNWICRGGENRAEA